MPDYSKELRWIRMLLIIIAIPIMVIILKTLRAIFIPLVFAIFLSFVFTPFIGFLRRKRVHYVFIMIIMISIITLFFFATIALFSAATNSLITGLPRYQVRMMTMMQDATVWIQQFGARMDVAFTDAPAFNLSQLLAPGSFSVTKLLSSIMTTTMNIGWNLFLIVVFFLFIIAPGGSLHRRLKMSMSSKNQSTTFSMLDDIQQKIQRYLLTKTMISLATALVGMLLMLIYGVDFILVCGILLFVLNFIPNIGSIIASAVPILIYLLEGGFTLRFVTFSILIIATQMLFGNVIEPKIQGDRLNLSPIVVLISLIFWGWVWGIAGMILAVPITSAINIILIQLDRTNLVSAIISKDNPDSVAADDR